MVEEFGLPIADLKRSEAKNEDRQRHLVDEKDSGVGPIRCCPSCCQAQEVSRIMRKDDAVLLRGKQELVFIIDAQVTHVSGRETIHPMLDKNYGERN